MQIKPQIGQTYISRTNPTMIVFVVDVNVVKPGEGADFSFIVEGCNPAYKDDLTNADRFEITEDIWIKYDFTLISE
jgi:hypothetical protein